MSKALWLLIWHTMKLESSKEMVDVTKNGKVVVQNHSLKLIISVKQIRKTSLKIIPGDSYKPKIINDGKECNIEESNKI